MTNKYKHITKHCFINAPWYKLKDEYLDLFLEYGIQPEIGFEGTCLYDESPEEFNKIAVILQENGLNCTMHAPFLDLAPGSADPMILKSSRNKLQRVFELIEVFKPRSIVCHLNFEENKQGYNFDAWLETALTTWKMLSKISDKQGVTLMLENTYEKTTNAHKTILTELNSPSVGFCLDVGHILTFANSTWQEWLPPLLPWLGQVHLHDNCGESDQHLAPGRGNFDFKGLFAYLRENRLTPLVTLEPHSEEDLWMSLDYLDQTELLSMLNS